ncbi:cytochrome P450 [Nocardiopsis suaedae]|uniref:Cytochrome P450 n=1 Tax=Nocardiopsis suaedae TaxID=3018444 RepID=A0ABT4TJK9_9ACTN|nr:cytochrome P450 [Nocardiopsis suaedae]MDA2804879.1 cytochrome P450 [Nocardiopsis suaedae]
MDVHTGVNKGSAAQLPFDRPHPLHTPPEQRRLLAQGPVHRVRTAVGHAAWLVTDHALVRALLDDARLGRAHPDPDNAARTGASALFGGPVGDPATEDADHARMRALLRPHFTPGRMRALRPRVARITAGLLDGLARRDPPADLVTALALPLPVTVICELLGVPGADRDRFGAWARAAADVTDRARSEQGLADLFGYGRELVERKRAEPGDDVLSRLAAAEGVSGDEAAMLAMSLLFAGYETTTAAIGLGALLLLDRPVHWRRLRESPDLTASAVEEVLRAPARGGGIPRYARTDLDIAGAHVRAGELVLLDTGAANHDPAVFTDPDRFDPARREGAHMSFGHGARYCIGAPLARIELQEALTALVSRFPGMRLAVPTEDLSLDRDVLVAGLTSLPVTW